MKKISIIIVFMLFLCISSTAVFASEISTPEGNVDKFGLLTLLPPIVAIALAFITKNVVLSLFVGVFSGTFLLSLNSYNVFGAFVNGFMLIVDKLLYSLADSWNAGVILQCLTIGGLIAVVSKMGGAKAIAEGLAKKAKSPRSAQIITWLLGILVFFDDYANSLIVGPIMRPVTDKMKVSREKLSFIVDATAAPVAGIAIISTWIGLEISIIKDAYLSIGQTVNSYNVFLATIPYRFYNILMLVFVILTALTLREFGPMLAAERKARNQSAEILDNFSSAISPEEASIQPKEGIKLSIWNAIVPIGLLIVVSLIGFYRNGMEAILAGGDAELIDLVASSPYSFAAIREAFGASDASVVLFRAALLSSVVAIIMAVIQKVLTFEEAINTWVQGVKSLVITGVILLLAWSISSVIKELGTALYLVRVLSDSIPKFILPSLIFIMGSVISFATGTSFGTMGILMPLAIPLAYAVYPESNYLLMCAGAVLTGAIFGDHCSPISDTTILSSMGAGCEHIAHVNTQICYSLVVGVITILFGYIPVGLGIPVYIVLPIGILAVYATIQIFGKKVE